jgi:hypothetical protein
MGSVLNLDGHQAGKKADDKLLANSLPSIAGAAAVPCKVTGPRRRPKLCAAVVP